MENIDLATAQEWQQKHLNAYKKALQMGDTESAKLFQQLALKAGTAAERLKMVQEMPTSERVLAGIGQGMTNVKRQLSNIFGGMSDEELQQAAELDQPLLGTKSGKVGSFIGETAATLPVGGIAGAGTKALGSQLGKNLLLRGAAEGAAQGAVLAGPEQRGSGAMFGAGAGVIAPAIGAGYKAFRSGVSATPEARKLMEKGVDLTPGLMNREGAWNQMEQLVSRVPVVGNVVTGQRKEAWKQAQTAIAQEVAPPGAVVQPRKDITHTVKDLQSQFGNAYDVVKGYPISPVVMGSTGSSMSIDKLFADIPKRMVGGSASKNVTASFLKNELSNLKSRASQGLVDSADVLKVRSNVRDRIRSEMSKQTVDNDHVNALKKAEEVLTDVLDSQLPPDVMQHLAATDAQFGKFVIFEDAVKRSKAQPEGFTPAQFATSVSMAEPSRSRLASGGARLQDISRSAASVFTDTVPRTGEQLVSGGVPGYLLYKAATSHPFATGTAALATALAGYVPAARKFVTGKTGLQEGLRDMERAARRKFTPAERETAARLLRTASVNYQLGSQSAQEQ